MATYKAKLFCFNCGMKGFYLLPFGLEFWPYITRSDSLTGEARDSYIEDTHGHQTTKSCRNCGLPTLDVDYWDEVLVNAEV